MLFDIDQIPASHAYKLMISTITPRPIALVTSISADGVVNAAPYSFFNAMGAEPPMLAIGIQRDDRRGLKDTAANIMESGEFVVNLVSEAIAPAMNITSIDAPAEIDELALAGLEPVASAKVRPPRIASAPVSFECVSQATLVTGPKQVIALGRIVAIHVADEAVMDPVRAYVDATKLNIVGRMHGSGVYLRPTDTFEMVRPRWADWQAKSSG